MYFFTDTAQEKKARYGRSKRMNSNQSAVVAFVKKCVQDGADLNQSKVTRFERRMATVAYKIRLYDLATPIEHSGEHYGHRRLLSHQRLVPRIRQRSTIRTACCRARFERLSFTASSSAAPFSKIAFSAPARCGACTYFKTIDRRGFPPAVWQRFSHKATANIPRNSRITAARLFPNR